MDTIVLLQHYWWLLVSLLGALLVFLLFVQGGQSMIYAIGKTPEDKSLIVNSLGRKWEFTFTTLVTFGGAFFASFPLFYSTSFGGAFYVWMAILLVFVIQAVSYEFRSKAGNFLGMKTYDAFLFINGCLGPLLIGTAVGTFFTGANFEVDTANIGNIHAAAATISHWTTPWRGLEAVLDYRNLCLGIAVLFLARSLGLLYFINNIDDTVVRDRSRKELRIEGTAFVIFFLIFLVSILMADGRAVDPATGVISVEPYKYGRNLLAMPAVLVLLLLGVLSALWGLGKGMFTDSRKGIWFAGAGTVATVLALLLTAGWNDTAYYPSLADTQSSLTIYNSSSSEFTLKVMSGVSVLIPFVVAYIWYAWRSINRKPVTRSEINEGGHIY
ncbi:cytochrome d ubiquinol oxidase subunit II [Rikenella microfusus]|uniref:Cytochrome d ubiquinol oxidase subunit 2 n=1 Tax=Rikenella microfusus TaxID=28139 RepID=A0A379MVX1_9BACT|nr:cytochrome d ubiquinol oxidase subunit II [Rikenella microfusus]SUE34987.1 Cytochrome d ubiquinol oxidase subunit 2 [Rikenella microfusus]